MFYNENWVLGNYWHVHKNRYLEGLNVCILIVPWSIMIHISNVLGFFKAYRAGKQKLQAACKQTGKSWKCKKDSQIFKIRV